MINASNERIDLILQKQKDYFTAGKTRDMDFRKTQLRKLAAAIASYEPLLCEALWKDLHKSREEAYLTEVAMVKSEISLHLNKLSKWSKPERVSTPIAMFPSKSRIVKEPLGTALIVSPWNYPFQLLLNPLVGAISSGCTAVLKPSPYVPNVSLAIEKMLSETFPEEYIAVVQGDRTVNSHLFESKFDLIFYTGSPAVGRKVMEAASQNLTPVILELGGKSPCIVSAEADIPKAARRIAWGKTLNSGQTCIAPDYILIDETVKDAFVREFAKAVKQLHSGSPETSPHLARMVSEKAFDRVAGYIKEEKVLYGGRCIREEKFIEPTLLDNPAADSPCMSEEIFGPVFPVITLPSEGFIDSVADFVLARPKPLAFYYFGKQSDGRALIARTSSGGACINDTIMHIVNPSLPFGGVGNSGIGSYHGKLSFEAFTHRKAVVSTPTWIDLPFKYMPYKYFSLIKKLM